MKKLAVIGTHPVQYYAPLFRLLNERGVIKTKVFYTWQQWQDNKYDEGFGKKVEWDIPLLEGYDHEFVPNEAKNPGIDHFSGIANKTLIKRIGQFNPDALLVFGWNYQSHLKVMRYFKGKIPVLFRGDSHLLDDQNRLKQMLRFLFLKWVYRYIDYALYVGSNNKDYFKKAGLKEDQLIYAPHAIDNKRFSDQHEHYQQEALKWRKTLNIKEEEKVILFAGKLEYKKAPEFLLETFLNLPLNHVKLILVGNGVLEERLKSLAKDDKRVIFLPFQNQSRMPVVYRLGDFFILPSEGPGETWGLAANEAMASGVPVILSDKTGGAIDLVDQGENGFIFKSGNKEELEGIIYRISEISGVEYQKMKENVLNKIRYFSFVHIVKPIEALLS